MYLVTLQRSPARATPAFTDELQQNSQFHRKVMDNVWIVDTWLGARALTEVLRVHLLATDQLLVIRVQDEYSGWLHRDVWTWLRGASRYGRFV